MNRYLLLALTLSLPLITGSCASQQTSDPERIVLGFCEGGVSNGDEITNFKVMGPDLRTAYNFHLDSTGYFSVNPFPHNNDHHIVYAISHACLKKLGSNRSINLRGNIWRFSDVQAQVLKP